MRCIDVIGLLSGAWSAGGAGVRLLTRRELGARALISSTDIDYDLVHSFIDLQARVMRASTTSESGSIDDNVDHFIKELQVNIIDEIPSFVNSGGGDPGRDEFALGQDPGSRAGDTYLNLTKKNAEYRAHIGQRTPDSGASSGQLL
ncbi:hypothetical protein EVAR_21722_1 [Eumeta japonica]|uniref:Uncharacterized protein n=1 Tax=Eumeta variegata TaxID=151549 RepID=A0A4C1W4Y3_EUMVA|nr:hypothetical protein EVAR_21722_1 [Eumeta japonica]